MTITVTVAGYQELSGDLKALPEKIEKSVLLQMSQIAFDSAQEGIGRHNKTGAMFQALYNRQIEGGRQVGVDPDRAPYAAAVNFGWARRKIEPKDKKALRWAGPNGFIFSKGHFIGPYIGDDFMGKAKDDALAQFQTVLDQALQESI